VQILRDLSSLQIQIRDIEGFRETRRQILVLKPGNRNNWMTFAIADYLSGEYSKAVNVIESYEKTIENPTANYDQSEMLLFKNSILRASRDLEAALVHLNNSEKFILDTLSFLEAKGTILLQLGKNAEACKVYEQLLDLNSENVSYHIGYAKAHGVEIIQNFLDPLSSQDVDTLSTLYAQLSTKFTKSFLVSRIPLDFLQGLPFEGALSEFLKKNLPKGIPSLFRNLRWLYVFDSKKRSFEIIINRFLANLESCLKFSISDDSKQYPSSLLWTYKFAAEHYDHCGQYEKALELVNKGIDHTPTAIDLYVTKSKILKHAGEIKAAFRVTDYARRLDLADRYLNSRAVKYAFKAGDVETAKSIVVLFLKERDTEQLHALFEMQCNWYEIAFGESLKQSGTFGKALKNFFAVHKHFDDYFEDQFDFHQYCIRKMTLNAYVESLKFGDAVKNHKFYFRATKNIVEIYLHLARQKLSKTSSEIDERKLSEADKKKLAIKTKQAKAKAAKEDVTKKAASKRDVSKRSEAARKYEEEDPDGLKLLNVSDYLSEAAKWVKDLELHCASFLDSHALAVKIHVSRKKFLLAFRALQRCIAKSPKSPITLNAMSHFIASWNKEVDHVDPIVSKIIQKNLDSIELIKNSQGILKLLRESCVSIYDAALYYEAVLRLNALAVRDALAFLFSFDLKNSSHKVRMTCSSRLNSCSNVLCRWSTSSLWDSRRLI